YKLTGSGFSHATIYGKYSLISSRRQGLYWTAGLGVKLPIEAEEQNLPQNVRSSNGAVGGALFSYLKKGFPDAGFSLILINRFDVNGENNSSVFTFNNTLPLNITVKKFIDDGCTAVWVTGEDMKVLEVNWIIQELAGKQIPNDISIIGFENPGISEFQRPSLTTVATPLQELAEKAVEIVLNNTLKELQKIKMYPKIIERNSVKNIGGKV
ncbi:MAG TPA: substrate-binding domain-containing protein, partial [Victivallales bacterium]|nr:substrate-binding domain-containing protein [Victivallales bacterium]